jgi:hypothetical protein
MTVKEQEEDARLDAMIDEIIAEERKLREKDPKRYEEIAAARKAEHEALEARMAEEAKWEYCVPDNIEERIKDTKYSNWYPACEQYSYLVNFPNNIQPDWLDAIEETANLILTQRGTMDFGDNPKATKGCIQENERLARLALKKAAALRAKA